MTFSWKRAMTIARREYLTTVKRRAFMFTVIFIPAYFAFIMTFTTKMATDSVRSALRETTLVGVVDSTGLFANAPAEIFTETDSQPTNVKVVSPTTAVEPSSIVRTAVRYYPDVVTGEKALRNREVKQLLVLPPTYLSDGKSRRYVLRQGVFSSVSDRLFGRWLSRGLLHGKVDSLVVDRVTRPTRGMDLYSLDKNTNEFTRFDDRKEMATIFLPIVLVGLLATSILTSGQYLLQGVTEERESRILESLLCTVSTDDLMVGKLVGLGGAGLTMVGSWTLVGAYFGGPVLAATQTPIPMALVIFGFLYFVLGYLFYASIMTAIGAITTNLREAQQYAMAFTFSLFIPFIVMWVILDKPEGPLAVALSLFPMTAPTASIMRLATGYAVPGWQTALSLGILAITAWLAMRAGSRVFRIGLLLYGKTPNLPEIFKWATSRG